MADARRGLIRVKVGGTELASENYALLADVRVEQSVQVPDTFTLRFEDAEFELLDSELFTFGDEVEIAMGYETPQVLMRGEVTALSAEPGRGDRHELVVTGLSRGHRLAHHVEVKTYLKQKVSAIASQVAQRHSLTPSVDATSGVEEHIIQTESDYAFLTRLARGVGYQWWVSEKKLYFKKSSKTGAGPELRWGEDLYKFKVRVSAAEASKEIQVRGWDPKKVQAVEGQAKPTAPTAAVLGTSAKLATTMTKKASSTFGKTRFNGGLGAKDKAEADAIAKAMGDRAAAAEVIARGVAQGDPAIAAGVEVKISGLGQKLSGKYVVTSAQHVMSSGEPYITRFQSGGMEASGLVDLLGGGNGHSAIWPSSHVAIGIVSNLKDPDKLGRVKVHLPTLGDDIETDWARLVTPEAGKDRGMLVRPEVKDEVLVAFEQGDLRRPLVLGSLWNGKNAPPATDDVEGGKVTRRIWQSREGHRIEMVDAASSPDRRIILALGDGKTELVIGEDKVVLTCPNDIEIKGDKNLKIEVKQGVKISAQKIELEAKQKFAFKAAQIEGKGDMSTKLEGTQVEVKASATMKLDGGGMTEVKGGMVKIN